MAACSSTVLITEAFKFVGRDFFLYFFLVVLRWILILHSYVVVHTSSLSYQLFLDFCLAYSVFLFLSSLQRQPILTEWVWLMKGCSLLGLIIPRQLKMRMQRSPYRKSYWQGQLYNGLSLTPLTPRTLPLHHFLMSPCYCTAALGPKSTPTFP